MLYHQERQQPGERPEAYAEWKDLYLLAELEVERDKNDPNEEENVEWKRERGYCNH